MQLLERLRLPSLFITAVCAAVLASSACSGSQAMNGLPASRLLQSWQSPQHAVWELHWSSGPVRSPLVFELWQAENNRSRIEILEADLPALIGESLVTDGRHTWRFNRFETQPPREEPEGSLPLISSALEAVEQFLQQQAVHTGTTEWSEQGEHFIQTIFSYADGSTVTIIFKPEKDCFQQVVLSSRSASFQLLAREIGPLKSDPIIFTPFEFDTGPHKTGEVQP